MTYIKEEDRVDSPQQHYYHNHHIPYKSEPSEDRDDEMDKRSISNHHDSDYSEHSIRVRTFSDEIMRDEQETDEHEDDVPLDLSMTSKVKRRDHDRSDSGTDSDDSTGHGEERGQGRAAYKKSLMKRYCEYFFVIL